MRVREQLLVDVDAYLRRTGVTRHAFGERLVRDGRLIDHLRDRYPLIRTIRKVECAIGSKHSVESTILKRVDQFIAEHRLSDAVFGQNVVNDWKFVGRLRTGNVGLRLIERVETYLDRHGDAVREAA